MAVRLLYKVRPNKGCGDTGYSRKNYTDTGYEGKQIKGIRDTVITGIRV